MFQSAEVFSEISPKRGVVASWESRLPVIPERTPFLLSPDFGYDSQLNAFFYSSEMLPFSLSTRIGYANDLGRFLTFLSANRGGRDWRDCTENDHLAFHRWRREDKRGPRVSASTWNREVSGVNRFYIWQLKQQAVRVLPIPQRARRHSPVHRAGARASGSTPATLTHAGSREHVRWLPSRSYRQWRDVGIRGYTPGGRVDPAFRGRWASRNAAFVDLMVRTGLRLSEESGLLVHDIPAVERLDGFHRFTLPAALAKGGRPRGVYIPTAVLRDVHEYIDIDRPLLVDRGRRRGLYRWNRGSLLLDPTTGRVQQHGGARSFRSELLNYEERLSLLVEGDNGLEPASLWLAESGDTMSRSTWQGVFSTSNQRCARLGVPLSAHAHLLRHTFAVLTLEHLQRGHIAQLRELLPSQRTAYQRVFGDPLDWVRRRLGHKSIETTHVYLHTLADLEMETRMALIPEEWQDPRDPSLRVAATVGAMQ